MIPINSCGCHYYSQGCLFVFASWDPSCINKFWWLSKKQSIIYGKRVNGGWGERSCTSLCSIDWRMKFEVWKCGSIWWVLELILVHVVDWHMISLSLSVCYSGEFLSWFCFVDQRYVLLLQFATLFMFFLLARDIAESRKILMVIIASRVSNFLCFEFSIDERDSGLVWTWWFCYLVREDANFRIGQCIWLFVVSLCVEREIVNWSERDRNNK